MAIAQTDLASLARVLSAKQILTNPIELLTYERDAAFDAGTPDAVAFPNDAQQVIKIVRWANQTQTPLIARGAGTGLSGGAVAERGGLIVEFSRMNQIVELDEAGRSVVVQPGVVNLVLDEFVKAKGLYYPPDPASGRTSTLGGNLAENAGGPHCFKYGVTTNYITGMKVVLADGREIALGGRALDYPEYDLLTLMTGSEGTLGIITQASARLLRNTPAVKTMMAAFDSVEEAGRAVSAVIARGLVPATMEMMDRKIMRILEDFAHAGLPVEAGAALIIEADGYPESVSPQMDEIAAILRDNQARQLRLAQTAAERDQIWYARKSAAGAMARLAPSYYLLDGTVPRSHLSETLAEVNQACDALGLRVAYVFHAGDGNLHPLVIVEQQDDPAYMRRVHAAGRTIMEICVSKDGSITGEHGVGIEKRAFMPLMYTPYELRFMLDVKEVFDPRHLLNPGKIFPADLPAPEPLARPSAVPASPCTPTTAQEAADALNAWLLGEGPRSVRIRGGGTKSAMLPPADAVLSTEALRGIRTYAVDDQYVTAGAGTRLSDLQAELAQDKMWVPIVSPWSESTLGGIVATNFNAPLRMRYGALRDLVLTATVALPNGRVIRAGRPLVKNVAGYDLPKLFVGSYGTLGVITDVTFKLAPLARARASLIMPVDDLASGLAWGARLLRVCLVASALLLCRGCELPGAPSPYALIYTAEGCAEDVQAELSQARSVLQNGSAQAPMQIDALAGSDVWASWMQAATPGDTVLRAGVAPKDMTHFVMGLQPALADAPFIADLASGLLYARTGEIAGVRRAALKAGGYAIVLGTGQRIGKGTDDIWGHIPEGLDLMRALKARWDASGLCNPGAFIL